MYTVYVANKLDALHLFEVICLLREFIIQAARPQCAAKVLVVVEE